MKEYGLDLWKCHELTFVVIWRYIIKFTSMGRGIFGKTSVASYVSSYVMAFFLTKLSVIDFLFSCLFSFHLLLPFQLNASPMKRLSRLQCFEYHWFSLAVVLEDMMQPNKVVSVRVYSRTQKISFWVLLVLTKVFRLSLWQRLHSKILLNQSL